MKRKIRYCGWLFLLFPLGAFAQTDGTPENTPDPIAVVNGYIVRYSELARLKSEYIASIAELDAEDAVKLFGERAKGGAIVIKLKGRNTTGTGEKVEEEVLIQAEEIAEQKAKEEAAEAERQRLAEEKAREEAAEAERRRLAEQKAREEAAEAERQRLAEQKAREEAAEAERKRLAEQKAREEAAEAERQRLAEEKAREEAAEAERQRLAEEKAREEAAEAERKRLAEEKASEEENKIAISEAEEPEESYFSLDFVSQLQKDFEKSVNDPKVKKILVNGQEVSREDALKINVFDVETSIVTYNTEKTESVLEISLSQKNKDLYFLFKKNLQDLSRPCRFF